MAYTFISASSAQSEGTSPVTVNYAATPSAGNLLIATIKRNSQSSTQFATVKDGNGNSFTQELFLNYNGTGSQIMLYDFIATASQSVAITASAPGTLFVSVYEFSGNQASLTGIIDASSTASGGSGTNEGGLQPSVTTTNANDLIFSTIGFSTTITSPAWTGATMLQENNSGGALIQLVDGYQIETSTGTFNPSLAWTSSRLWGHITAAYKPASGGGPAQDALSGFLPMMGMGT